jgi:hypothetical protein
MTFRSRQNNGTPNNATFWVMTCESEAGSASSVTQNHARHVWEKSTSRELLTAANGYLTVSFWYNTSTLGTHAVMLDFGASFTGPQSSVAAAITQTAPGWQYHVVTFYMPITGNGSGNENDGALFVNIGPRAGGIGQLTWAAGQNFNITQIVVNAGIAPIKWKLCGDNEADELAICQRYYEKSYDPTTTPGTGTSAGAIRGISAASGGIGTVVLNFLYKTKKRTGPSIAVYSTNGGSPGFIRDEAGADRAASLVTSGTSGVSITNSVGTSGVTGHQCHVVAECDL